MATAVAKYPTPRATDGNKPAYGDKNHQGLQARIQFPTPAGNEGFNRRKKHDSQSTDGLETTLRRFPTPNASIDLGKPIKDRKPNPSGGQKPPLVNVVGGQLNPTWVDWLMGYPVGWTDLRASGMRLSLK